MTHPQNEPHPSFARQPPEVWARARSDYLSGASAALVAERHGLSERNVRRRAAMEGWRRSDAGKAAIAGDWPHVDRPWWTRARLDPDDAIDTMPELKEVAADRAHRNMDLLFHPDPQTLGRFAFQKAAEAAAMNGPSEALAWLRLIQVLERTGDRIRDDNESFSSADYLRAEYIRRLDEADERITDPETTPSDIEGTDPT